MIRLAVNVGRRFKAGALVEEAELEPAFLEQLLAAGHAERVGAELVSAALADAIAAVKAAGDLFMAAIDTVVDAALAGPPAAAVAVEAALDAWFKELSTEERSARRQALKEALRRGHEIHSEGAGPQTRPEGEAASPVAASEGDVGSGAASPEIHGDGSGEPLPSLDGATEREAPAAPTDAPQPEAGQHGDAGAPAPAEPAAQAEPTPKKPARKGGGKAAG